MGVIPRIDAETSGTVIGLYDSPYDMPTARADDPMGMPNCGDTVKMATMDKSRFFWT